MPGNAPKVWVSFCFGWFFVAYDMRSTKSHHDAMADWRQQARRPQDED
ncbi:hypothetical protein [Streptomyces sp. NPDC050485]